jgi:putative redox protein
MTAIIKYNGSLRTTAIHIRSGNSIITDAPVDNHGKGAAFSPTDLLATSLGSCMLSIMGIVAERNGIDLKNTEATVEKIMAADPRRVAQVNVTIIFPPELKADSKQRQLLENAALTCPVAKSLHSDLVQSVKFEYR